MWDTDVTRSAPGLTLRQAALTAGFSILVMVICGIFAAMIVFPKYLIFSDIAQTVDNIRQAPRLFFLGVMGPFITFTMDIIAAWALYWLFRPVSPAFSLLTAWFRLVYAVIAFVAIFKLLVLHRLATSPDAAVALGERYHEHLYLLLYSYEYVWSAALVLFGVYLLLLGVLIVRAPYVPTILTIPVAIAGVGWIVDGLAPYLAPNLDLGWTFYTIFGELFFMAWLLIGGWFLTPTEAE